MLAIQMLAIEMLAIELMPAGSRAGQAPTVTVRLIESQRSVPGGTGERAEGP